jgi:hypothetical protein
MFNQKAYDIDSNILKDIFLETYENPDLMAVHIYKKVRAKKKGTGFGSRTMFLRYVDGVVKPLIKDFTYLIQECKKLQKLVLKTKEEQHDIAIIVQKMDVILQKIQDEMDKVRCAYYYTQDDVVIFEDAVINVRKEYTTILEGFALALKEEQEKLEEYNNIICTISREIDALKIELEQCKKLHPEEKGAIEKLGNKLCELEDKISVMKSFIEKAQLCIQNGDMSLEQQTLITEIGSLGNQIGFAFENLFGDYTTLLKQIEEKQNQQALEQAHNKQRERRRQERRDRRRKRRGIDVVTRGISGEVHMQDYFDYDIKCSELLQMVWELEQEIG